MKLLAILVLLVGGQDDDVGRSLSAQEAQSILGCVETLGTLEPQAAADCIAMLRSLGDPALEVVLAQHRRLPRLARRRIGGLLAESGGAILLEAARPLARDDDPEIRRDVLRFLGRPGHGELLLAERVELLAERAMSDPEPGLRQDALRLLAELGNDLALSALDGLIDRIPQEERRWAAALLGSVTTARGIVERRVHAAFTDPDAARRLGDDALALLLPSYGTALAERPDGGASARDRAPLIIGRRHPSNAVRRGALLAFERLIARLRALGQTERALRLLDELARQGLDRYLTADQRAQIALFEGDDPERALSAARELAALADPLGAHTERAILARAHYLESLAHAAAGHLDEAHDALEKAAALLDGLIAERSDLWSEDLFPLQVEHLRLRASMELCSAALYIARGRTAADAAVVERARRLHRFSLEAQLVETRGGRGADRSLDAILQDPLSPYTLLFANRRWPAWPAERALETQTELGDALAAVCPREMPGFTARTEEALGPLDDPERLVLMSEILYAQMDAIDDMIVELADQRDDPLVAAQILQLRRIKLNMWRELRDGEDAGSRDYLLDQRDSSEMALWLVGDLRTEGRTTESRALALKTRAALEATGEYHRSAMLAAEVEMAIGSSWSDEDEPERAEKELTKAVERLEGLEAALEERGADPRQIARVQLVRSSALVSLAVNANVKLQDAERALGFFERAYELRRDDFMKVLLACYRARSGKPEEARAALAEVIPSPNVYYNLACTYSLLGDANEALEFLRREFEENHPSEGSLERQKLWARRDPDLEFLRGNPRFERLVAEKEER